MTTKTKVIEIKPYNIKELADIYGVKRGTMTRWLTAHQQAIGEKIGRYFSALQVEIIFERLGLPKHIADD